MGIFYKSDYQSGSSNLESSSAAVSSSLAVESEVSEEPSTEELKQEANEFDEMMWRQVIRLMNMHNNML